MLFKSHNNKLLTDYYNFFWTSKVSLTSFHKFRLKDAIRRIRAKRSEQSGTKAEWPVFVSNPFNFSDLLLRPYLHGQVKID